MLTLDYAIMTVKREPEYIHGTLASMNIEEPVKLVVGSLDTSFLEPYRSDERKIIIEADAAQWGVIKDKSLAQRIGWNYWRALTLCGEGADGLALFEDDVYFAKGWQPYLKLVTEGLISRLSDNFILALYCPYKKIKWALEHKYQVIEYPGGFFGTQGMYYTSRTRRECAEYLRVNAVERHGETFDVLVGKFAHERGVKLLAIVPSLVQHMGSKTTGIAAIQHQSPAFVMEIILRGPLAPE